MTDEREHLLMKNHRNARRTALSLSLAAVVLGSAGLAQAANLPVAKEPQANAAAQSAPARIIVRYKDGSAAAANLVGKTRIASAAARNALKGAAVSHKRSLVTGAELFTVSGRPTRAQLQAIVANLNADSSVEFAEIDERLQPLAVPNDPYFASHNWHLQNVAGGINAPAAWDISKGAGAVVAVLDTGILPEHPDFEAGALLQGYDFITDSFVSRRPTDDRVPGALDYGDWNDDPNECDIDTSSWHGTHVAGTVAQGTNDGIGMAGVAPKATILPVRVLGRCGGYNSDIAEAITWASGGSVNGVPANPNPAQVINMSLGGGGACGNLMQNAINGAVSRGTTVVVAAGNSNGNVNNYSPASCDNVITVGANRYNGGRASYSNYGTKVDLAAPGGGGGTDGNPNGYVWQSISYSDTGPYDDDLGWGGMAGTSMAAPHVAGVVALVQSALVANNQDPLTPAAMEQLLKDTARAFPVSIPTNTPIGVGIVDPVAALNAALVDGGEPGEPGEPGDPGEPGGPQAIELVNKVALTGQSGGEQLYRFEAQAGAVLTIMTYGGSGDVSVYVKQGAEPSAASNDAFSTRAGNSETVRINAPVAGTYFIKLTGSYSGVSVVARQ